MTNGIWAEMGLLVNLVEDPDPNITGSVLIFTDAGGWARFVYSDGVGTAGIATRLWLAYIPVSDNSRPPIHQYRDGSNNAVVTIVVSPTGALQVYRGRAYDGVKIAETAGPVLTANAWRHVESKVYSHASAGTVEIRVEGRVVLDETGLNTGGAEIEQVAIGNRYGSVAIGTDLYMKDVVFWNGSGSVDNDFIGPCGVYWCPVDADVSSGWSRTSGSTDWQLLNESPPNDTGYIYAGEDPIPDPSIMNVTALPPDIIAIRAILPVTRGQKSDGGDGSDQVSISPNGTDWDDGADRAISTAFTYYWDVSEISPTTLSPWTPVEFSTLQMKINRTA